MTKLIVDECMNITNAIRTDYKIDILETNDNYEITDKVIHCLLSNIHCTSIKLPSVVEIQLRNSRLLKDMIHKYRHYERYFNLLKRKTSSSIKSIDEEDILMIEATSLCDMKLDDTYDLSSVMIPETGANLTKLMKKIHQQHENKSHKKANPLLDKIKALLKFIVHEEITYEYLQNEIKISNEQKQSKYLRTKRKKKNQTIQILPYENTYNEFYYPDHSVSIEQTMIDKIVKGVQAMATALTNRKDIEDVLNGIAMLADQSTSPADELMSMIQKRNLTEKQGYTNNGEQLRVRTALDLIIADNRLNGKILLCPSDSIVLSRIIRKISLCTQERTLCSYGDVITIINDSDYHQIRLRTHKRMSLSSDEFIEILGEMYHTSYDTIENMKYYLDSNDIMDLDTNLIYSSILTSKQIDDMIKYIVREDAIRQLFKLIVDRTRNKDSHSNDQYVQFKLMLPMKLNELYQTIKKLNAFMSTTQVMTALRKPYVLQLTNRSKIKSITVNDLRTILSQIWFTQDTVDMLISEKIITMESLSQFYIDFHETEDIDERLNKICKKVRDHLNLHSCVTRVLLKMLAEHSNGTIITSFLDEYNRFPRFISIVDIFDDLIASGLISTTELLVHSKQDIIIKKSSFLKHFESILFFHKRDADLLAEITLVMREDDLIEYLTQRAKTIKDIYIQCILNNDERRNFITKNLIESTNRLSSLSIHEFIHCFNLDPNCAKIFYWMGFTDENIVKTLIEIKTFVNEYTLDGIYHNFLMRLHDTLESGIHNVSMENLINYDKQKEYFTIKKRDKSNDIYQIITENYCKLGCYLTYKQASILVDYADPEYEHQLSSLITIHDIIPMESLKKILKSSNNQINFDETISTLVIPKQNVIECKILLDSFRQRIDYRQKRFKRIENLQKLLLSSMLMEQLLEIISQLGIEYFTPMELDYLEDIKLIDIGILAILLTLPSYNPLIHEHKYAWLYHKYEQETMNTTPNYLHILDPVIEKYSIFLTIMIIRIISKKERIEKLNEILLLQSDSYLSTEEILKICIHEQILTYDHIQQICQDSFPHKQTSNTNDMNLENIREQVDNKSATINIYGQDNHDRNETITIRKDLDETNNTATSAFDCYTQHMFLYKNDSVHRNKMEQSIVLAVFDYILHYNHRSMVNEQLRQLFHGLRPLAIYKAQLLIEKEMIIIKLLLKIRKKRALLTTNDLHKYLESYPIPCRLDIVNELRRAKVISQSLTTDYTMNQCYELKSSTPEVQTSFLFYMLIKLIQKEGYIDESNIKDILHQYQTDKENENFNRIFRHILRNGFLTIEQITQSAKDFFLQDYLNEDILLKNRSSEYKTVIQQPFLIDILNRKPLTNAQFELALSQSMRRRQVIQTTLLADQLKHARIAKEKVQRKVDHVLLKVNENHMPYSKLSFRLTDNSLTKHKKSIDNEQQFNKSPHTESLLTLRSLRHNYIQAKIPRNQLHLLVEQGGWSRDIYLEFKRELNIIDSDNSLDLIRHITSNISLLLKENGSIAEKPLMKHFQQHQILFHADFELLLIRYGMVALEDLLDLLTVSKLAKVHEIQSYAKSIFCLNVNKYKEISKSQENGLVKKPDVQNNVEKKLCITAEDLAQLLNHVLKLDRLKRIIAMMTTIKNYLRQHPINTFNALKALKLEFDFNHDDMKFLRDLKLISEAWYKRYILSQTNETSPRASDITDEEQEHDEQNQFKFQSPLDDEFDLDSLNELFDGKSPQYDLTEEQKQAYLEKLRKQKIKMDSLKYKTSIDEGYFPLSIDPNDLNQQQGTDKDQLHVIEQYFPDALKLGPQHLVPYVSDHRNRFFYFELDFAQEGNIDDYDKQCSPYHQDLRKSIKQQTNQYSDTIEEQSMTSNIQEIIHQISPSVDKTDQEKYSIDETNKLHTTENQSVHKSSSIDKESKSNSMLTLSPISNDNILHPLSIESSPSNNIIGSSSLPQTTVNSLTPFSQDNLSLLKHSFEQMTEVEHISIKQNIELIRRNITQWLQYNEHISNAIQNLTINNNLDEYSTQYESMTNQLIDYFHNEIDLFNKNDINNSNLKHIFQQRINRIETILQEKKTHQQMLNHLHQQIISIEQMIHLESEIKSELIEKFNNLKNNFNNIQKQEYLHIQPMLNTDLDLTIRTFDIDLQFIEEILSGKTLNDIIPDKPSIIIQTSNQFIPADQSQTYKDMIFIRDNLSRLEITMQKSRQTITNEKSTSEDLLKRDISDRLQAIRNEYAKQKLNEEKLQNIKINIDKIIDFDWKQIEFIETVEEIHNALTIEYDEIQKHLLNITTARYYSDHSNFPLDVQLRYIPIDDLGNRIEQPLCLIDERNLPISDQLSLIRLPNESDHFHISNDKYELIIVDNNDKPLSEPITFRQLTSKSIQFEYIDDNQKDIQIIDVLSQNRIHQSIKLNVKSVSFDKLSTMKPIAKQDLFVVDNHDQLLLSKSIQLIGHTSSSLNISDLNVVTYLYDEQTNEKVLLSPEHYLVSIQQAEFTPRKFLTYIIGKDRTIISEPISISNTSIQIRHAIENKILNTLELFDRQQYELFKNFRTFDEKNNYLKLLKDKCEFINGYVQDRIDKLRIEEKIIELIIPILDQDYEDISIDETEYRYEQSNMDNLLTTMKSFLELDEKLTEYRNNSITIESLKIEKLENDLIHQLSKISIELHDPFITSQIQNLINHIEDIQLLSELRPIILSGIKHRAKTIQQKFENLLINTQIKSDKLKQWKQVQFEYTQFLNMRFNEEMEHEQNIQNLYDKIEKMQYNLYQKIADSSETIKIEDLNKEIKHIYDIKQISIPYYLKTKNEKLIYLFNFILRFLQNKLKIIEQSRNYIYDEFKHFHIKSIDHENFYSQQLHFIENELYINQQKKRSKLIKKFKVLLNKIETITVNNLQYDFLHSKFDRFYELLVNKYQMNLPTKTNISLMRDTLTNTRKKLKKEIEDFDKLKNELIQKLDVLKTKEELKQRTKTIPINEEFQFSSLNAYIQQSLAEPLNIHHEFYIMKIEQISTDLLSIVHTNNSELHSSYIHSIIKAHDHLKIYQDFLDQRKIEYENKLNYIEHEITAIRQYSLFDSLARQQMEDLIEQQNKCIHHEELIVKMQKIVNEAVHRFQSIIASTSEQDKTFEFMKQFKQKAVDTIIQSVQYERFMKHVSPNLLMLHNLTTGQEFVTRFATKLFQLETKISTQQESLFEMFHFQYESSNNFQKDSIQTNSSLNSNDSKIDILQAEINFLNKQYYESIAIGDFTRQLAAEQAIAIKRRTIEFLQDESPVISQTSIENQQATVLDEKALDAKQINEQMHEFIQIYDEISQKNIQNDQLQLSKLQMDTSSSDYFNKYQNEVVELKTVDSLTDYDQSENSRQQQIHQTSIENTRSQLDKLQQQGSLIISSDRRIQHDEHIQRVPIASDSSEFPVKTIRDQQQITSARSISKLLLQIDSKEHAHTSLVTTNAKELYKELEKMKYSMEINIESIQKTSDIEDKKISPKIPIPMKVGVIIEHNEEHNTVDDTHKIRVPRQTRLQPTSIEVINSVVSPINDMIDRNKISSTESVDILRDRQDLSSSSSSSSSLVVVGNARKYSVNTKKSKDQQIPTSTRRPLTKSQRQYGEVYVRQRLIDTNASVSKFNEQNEKLRDKVKPKTRLVKYDKTKQGNTVIHQRVNLSKNVLLVPQQTMYEENLEPIPPLIHVQDLTNTFKLNSTTPLVTTSNINTKDSHSQRSEMKQPFYSISSLSPILEEPELTESSTKIQINRTNKELLTKNQSITSMNFNVDNKQIEKISSSVHGSPSKSMTMTIKNIIQPIDKNQQIELSSFSEFDTHVPTLNTINIKTATISQSKIEEQLHETKSYKSRPTPMIIEKIEDDIDFETPTNDDESLNTEAFSIVEETPQLTTITSEGNVIFHKVGGKQKKKKKSTKAKSTNIKNDRIKTKVKKIDKLPQQKLIRRKAVPFISATLDEQMNVEDELAVKFKKKKRKRSDKSPNLRSSDRSRSSSKKRKQRPKNNLKIENTSIDSKLIKNKDAIAKHLLNVKRFTVSPLSAIQFDKSTHDYSETRSKANNEHESVRLQLLKPMIKNFELDNNHQNLQNEIHNIDAYDLDKELFDFNHDTKEIDQPPMFTEYIPEFFQKQAEEKQIRRISLTAIKTDEYFLKRLAPRVPQLYKGWQPSDTICAHTSEFRPLNRYLMTDLSYYFDKNFIDESGLFQDPKTIDKTDSRPKQTTQRFRDDYIVKEFFNCWKDYTTEQARIAELRRRRITIDFREFWFQDALSDPFYSYFNQPFDYIKKQDHHHQMAYRLHKRLVRTGREQPKETMNNINRSSFLPVLFNLPKNKLDRQVSLNRRRQLINYDDKNYLIPLSNLITNQDEILSLIRERIQFINRSKTHVNLHRDEFAIKELLLNTSLLQQGTIKDLDKFITDYFTSIKRQDTKLSSSSVVKLPKLKLSSHQSLTISN